MAPQPPAHCSAPPADSRPCRIETAAPCSAVGLFYPLSSRISGSPDFGVVGGLLEFGGIGTFGIQDLPDGPGVDLKMLPSSGTYNFEKKTVYNLDGSEFIAHKVGASGAHSDIAGPEVAHAIWEAAFASV